MVLFYIHFTGAGRGKPSIAPDGEIHIPAKSSSRSLNFLEKQLRKQPKIRWEYKRGKFKLDVSEIIGERITIDESVAINLAMWILDVYNKKRSRK